MRASGASSLAIVIPNLSESVLQKIENKWLPLIPTLPQSWLWFPQCRGQAQMGRFHLQPNDSSPTTPTSFWHTRVTQQPCNFFKQNPTGFGTWLPGASSPPSAHTFGLSNTKPQPLPKPPNSLLQVHHSTSRSFFLVWHHSNSLPLYPNPHRHGVEVSHFSSRSSLPDTANPLCQSFTLSPDQTKPFLPTFPLGSCSSDFRWPHSFSPHLPQMQCPMLAPVLQQCQSTGRRNTGHSKSILFMEDCCSQGRVMLAKWCVIHRDPKTFFEGASPTTCG